MFCGHGKKGAFDVVLERGREKQAPVVLWYEFRFWLCCVLSIYLFTSHLYTHTNTYTHTACLSFHICEMRIKIPILPPSLGLWWGSKVIMSIKFFVNDEMLWKC